MAARHWALTLWAGLASPVMADEAPAPNLAAQGTGTQGGVAQLALAQQLYALAVARHDAQATLAAARLARGVVVRDIELSKDSKTIEGLGATSMGVGVDGPLTADAMLVTARALAGNDETALTLIDAAEAERPDGALTATRSASHLDPAQQDIWKMPFFGGALAEIAVIGDGDANLDLRVADENDATICQHSGLGDTIYCDWVPAQNGYFAVTVSNHGSKQNSYFLLMN